MPGGASATLAALVVALATRDAAPPGEVPPDEATVALQWRAPAGCPDGARVRDEIRRFVATGAQTGTVDRVVVDAQVVRDGDRYVLELDLKLPGGAMHKRIEADKCEVLASAAALVMAVMLDPTAVVEAVDAPAEPAPTPVPAPTPRVEPPPAAPKPVPPKRKVQAIVRAFAVGSYGAMPNFGAAFGGSVGARIGRARVEAVAFGELPQRRSSTMQPSAGARIDLWTLGARGCFAPAVKRIDFPLCAGVEAGQMRARGYGLEVARSAAAPWVAFPFGAAVMWAPVPRFAFGGGVDAWVAATRPTFEVEDLGVVHRADRLGVRIHAGLEVRLP